MIEQTLKCDILGRRATTAKPIRKVRITIDILKDDLSHSITPFITETPIDMCPDAIKRAIAFAKRAVSPPNIAATKAAEATGDAK